MKVESVLASTLGFLLAGAILSGSQAERRASGARGTAAISETVDHYISAAWRAKGVAAAELADDAEFVRRVYLDLTGKVPEAEEARAFIESPGPGKRQALVERLLSTPDFASHWARIWTNLLLGRKRPPRFVDRQSLESWFETRLASGSRYDQMVRELITATGNPVDNGAVNYLLRFELKPEDIAESVSSSFLGIQLACARCHNHPYEPWTQEDFYGLAAAFAGLDRDRPTRGERMMRRTYQEKRREMQSKRKEGGEMTPAERREARAEMMEAVEELRRSFRLVDNPSKKLEAEIAGQKKTMPVRFLDGSGARGNVREALAAWMIRLDNPYFSQALVNRIWGELFGRGLVEPVDGFGKGNPPSHPQLLAYLASDFSSNGCDLRRLFRGLMGSRAYQLSSRYGGERPAPEIFAVARLRRLSPEQLFESLLQVSGVEQVARRRQPARFEERKEIFFRQFVFLFDTDAVNDEEVSQGSIPQALSLLNGFLTHSALVAARPGLLSGRAEEEKIDELFLRALARYPAPDEKVEARDFLTKAQDKTKAYEDLLWALLNTSEFVLNH